MRTLKSAFDRVRESRRLDRQFAALSRAIPPLAGPVRAVRPGGPLSRLRLPIGALLVAGGLFSFLPLLGSWMLPLGLLLIAVDVPRFRRPVSWSTIRGRRFVSSRLRAWPFRKASRS